MGGMADARDACRHRGISGIRRGRMGAVAGRSATDYLAKRGCRAGSTGLAFETTTRASTGFVLAKDAWGAGFASEALAAVVNIAAAANVRRLYALCHVRHERSVRVLERCGFVREGILHGHTVFPNLGLPEPQDVYCYAQIFDRPQATAA